MMESTIRSPTREAAAGGTSSGALHGKGGGRVGGRAGLWGQGVAPAKATKAILHPPLKPQHLLKRVGMVHTPSGVGSRLAGRSRTQQAGRAQRTAHTSAACSR